MSDTNYPYGGDGWGQPSNGLPGHGPGHESATPPSSAPSATPPVSAPSATPGPWNASAPSGPHIPTDAPGVRAPSTVPAGPALRQLGIGNPLPTFVSGAVAYVVALLAALVVIVSVVLASFVIDTGDVTGGAGDLTGGAASPSGGEGWRIILGLLGIPFQLVSLASFGSYEMELGLGFFGSASLAWRGMPLLITVAMVASAFFAARICQRRWSSNGVLGALLWSGISGLTVAIIAVIATRVTAVSITAPSMGASLSMHSAGFDMFLGTWALITLPLLLGHMAGMEKPAWWPLVADLAAAPRLALVHALAFAVPVWVVMMAGGAIGMTLDGDGQSVLALFLALPVWGMSLLAVLPGLGMLVVPLHVNASGGVEDLGVERTNGFVWFFDLPWYGWVPMVLIALVMPLVVALLWNRDREIPTGNIPALVGSWLALPLAYFGGSVVTLALVWTSMHAEIGFMGNVALNAGLALWMPLVAFFIGLAVEAIARFGAPYVDRFVPGLLVNWFRRSARARRTTPSTH